MSADVERLRELAEAATPGPWRVEVDGGIDPTGEGWSTVEVSFDGGDEWCGSKPGLLLGDHEAAESDAAFIAAADPPTVLALLDALTAAQGEVERLRAERHRCFAIGHPTVTPESLIPCQLNRGHEGDHYSTSGCSGGAVRWVSAEAELAALRARIEVVRQWAMTIHGGTKSPADVWPGLREPLGIDAPDATA